MKYFITLLIAFQAVFIMAQSTVSSINMELPAIEIRNLNPGDQITVPVIMKNRLPSGQTLGGMCIGFQLFISIDTTVLLWNGTKGTKNGVVDFHPLCPYSSVDWLFNLNKGGQIACLWQDPKLVGQDFPDDIVLFKLGFTYLGGLKEEQSTPLQWGKEAVIEEGIMLKGKTDAFSSSLKPYDNVILVDGSITRK